MLHDALIEWLIKATAFRPRSVASLVVGSLNSDFTLTPLDSQSTIFNWRALGRNSSLLLTFQHHRPEQQLSTLITGDDLIGFHPTARPVLPGTLR